MAKRIDLDKVNIVEIIGGGLILDVLKDEMGRILVRVESEKGGSHILIKQHEEYSGTIVYSLDEPQGGPHLTLVED